MSSVKLFETIADISYSAGYNRFYTGDSRSDVKLYIFWAKEFEKEHAHTDWNENDYMIMIEEYTLNKIKDLESLIS